MKYRVEYHANGWFRPAQTLAEGQTVTRTLDDGRRLSVILVRFPGTTGPGSVVAATLDTLQEDHWGRQRWHRLQNLQLRDLEIIEAAK